MVGRSNTFAHTKSDICRAAQLLCSGVVHLEPSRIWGSLIVSERLTITCWPAGECLILLVFAAMTCDLLPSPSPTLVANLWDVTDRDIDKLSQAVFDKLRLTPEKVRERESEEPSEAGAMGVSVVTAVAEARESCKLKYLTGAAPVVYGIPFYL